MNKAKMSSISARAGTGRLATGARAGAAFRPSTGPLPGRAGGFGCDDEGAARTAAALGDHTEAADRWRAALAFSLLDPRDLVGGAAEAAQLDAGEPRNNAALNLLGIIQKRRGRITPSQRSTHKSNVENSDYHSHRIGPCICASKPDISPD